MYPRKTKRLFHSFHRILIYLCIYTKCTQRKSNKFQEHSILIVTFKMRKNKNFEIHEKFSTTFSLKLGSLHKKLKILTEFGSQVLRIQNAVCSGTWWRIALSGSGCCESKMRNLVKIIKRQITTMKSFSCGNCQQLGYVSVINSAFVLIRISLKLPFHFWIEWNNFFFAKYKTTRHNLKGQNQKLLFCNDPT